MAAHRAHRHGQTAGYDPGHGHPVAADDRRRLAEEPARPQPIRPAPAPRPAAPATSGRPAPAAAAPKRRPFTFGYGARQVRIGPVAFWTVVGTLVIMAGWSVVTATYFAFHDDVITRMIARQAEIEAAYEDRIAEMRSQVDRVTTRQLLDQEQFEQKLEQVIRRQSALESRASALGSIGGAGAAAPDVTGAIRAPGRNAPPEPATPKASPISDTVIFKTPPDRQARLESRQPPSAMAAASRNILPGIEGKIARLHGALDRLEGRQTASLASLEETYESKAKRIRAVLADLGLERTAPPEKNVGGPFVPYRLASVQPVFERQVQRVRLAREQAERLSRTLVTIPIRKPVAGNVDFSSTFGVRLDPFLGRPAMHTGLDFRGSVGEPIRATANGTVTTAGWSGGYGKLVEIDHGHGLSTRYGHMSEILVRQGQSVKIGQVIGRIGSTGRSTGPHLHYETRVSGDAVDPQKFLRAGLRMGAL
ncbi:MULTISPECIES: peptidoglycan DD-metalloendopeptidase family protein [Rhodoplanes]|uniref:peptidoglycan DD-metalloendopeptidase family protein n=1 Tax=Rhodoplanes TaxID=29407 RepID=UPI003520384F